MKQISYYTLSLCLILLSTITFGQRNAFKFDRITLDEGLSQSTINCIFQDSKGFIWFGTRGGLNRYDGSEFKVYLHNPSDSTSISNNIIYTIFEDRDSLLWIGTHEGLNVFDKNTHRFFTFKKDPNSTNSLSNNIVKSIIQDKEGNYWIGTDGGGLNKLTLKEGEGSLMERANFQLFEEVLGNAQSLSSNHITSLRQDRYGIIWVGTKAHGINKFDPKVGKFKRLLAGRTGITDNHINHIYEDLQGQIWVGTDRGLNRILRPKKRRTLRSYEIVRRYRHKEGNQYSLSNDKVLHIVQGVSGMIWIGTDGGGLNKYDKKTGRFLTNRHDVSDPNSIISNIVRVIFDDKVGTLWLGTNAGISKIDAQRPRFKLYTKAGTNQNELSSNNIQALARESSGITWIGTLDGGLNKYDPKTNKYTLYTTDGIYEHGERISDINKKNRTSRRKRAKAIPEKYLSDARILSLYRDRNRALWIGTEGGGLNKFDLRRNKFIHFKANEPNPDSLSHNTIRTIFKDRRGLMWLGTEGGGLNRFYNGKFKRFTKDPNNINSLSHNDVRAIAEDNAGNLWVGTFGGGLNKFNTKSENFTHYRKIEGQENSISSNIIFSVHVDKSGHIWIGTSAGLNKLDPSAQTITSYTVADGLPNNLIYGILDDNKGNLWLSTNKGISRFNKKNETFKNYDRKDGLQSNEFNPGSFTKSTKGEMFFGGINGFNSFHPTQIQDNNLVPAVLITDFKIFNKEVTIDSDDSPLEKHISETKEITLSYDQASLFSFDFVALNFTHADKNQYAYMMENFDEDWNYVGNRRFVNFTNLAPGHYTFRVKASNNDGVWNEEGTSLIINIKSPFWATWWFRFLILIAAFGFSYGVYKLRILRIEHKKVMLQRQVAERTNELQRKSAELEMQKEEVKAQNELLEEKNKEITLQRNNIEEKKKQLEKAWDEVLIANEELKKANSSLEEKVQERTAKLKHALDQLIVSNKELDTFLYRASHDLKGPITRLLGLTQLAKIDISKSKEIDYIGIIEMASIEMNKTLNKLMNIHSINANPILFCVIDVNELLEEVKKPYVDIIKKEKLDIQILLDEKAKIISDSSLLKIIFENLFENAITFRNEVNPKIIISLATDEHTFVMKMEDNGLGIESEFQNKIFEMFFRGSEVSKGNGLGLYLVKKAIDKLQGKIIVESEEGKYSSFSISIPKGHTLTKEKNSKLKA
ncbi:two-component regulator propeller domain-containing protein [Fulvivirgaceae bacterium BMA10]|uniref:histidine kinase n=1 Tax=Splendidivirga corallicola TaxID=3051826 RepID=A0ABT8KLX9_9BACT|nr:two-component regulator propeller domain-containing protein [Fulvivirgaceae bacterium BMA10]